jgi:hypothetical protein
VPEVRTYNLDEVLTAYVARSNPNTGDNARRRKRIALRNQYDTDPVVRQRIDAYAAGLDTGRIQPPVDAFVKQSRPSQRQVGDAIRRIILQRFPAAPLDDRNALAWQMFQTHDKGGKMRKLVNEFILTHPDEDHEALADRWFSAPR